MFNELRIHLSGDNSILRQHKIRRSYVAFQQEIEKEMNENTSSYALHII